MDIHVSNDNRVILRIAASDIPVVLKHVAHCNPRAGC